MARIFPPSREPKGMDSKIEKLFLNADKRSDMISWGLEEVENIIGGVSLWILKACIGLRERESR